MCWIVLQGVDGFCLAIQPADGDMGTIGRKCQHYTLQIFTYKSD